MSETQDRVHHYLPTTHSGGMTTKEQEAFIYFGKEDAILGKERGERWAVYRRGIFHSEYDTPQEADFVLAALRDQP